MLEIHVTDPEYMEYVDSVVHGDHPNVIRDEDTTLWVYHNTLTGMLESLTSLACMHHIEGAYPHRRTEIDGSCSSCGTVTRKDCWWVHRWWE